MHSGIGVRPRVKTSREIMFLLLYTTLRVKNIAD